MRNSKRQYYVVYLPPLAAASNPVKGETTKTWKGCSACTKTSSKKTRNDGKKMPSVVIINYHAKFGSLQVCVIICGCTDGLKQQKGLCSMQKAKESGSRGASLHLTIWGQTIRESRSYSTRTVLISSPLTITYWHSKCRLRRHIYSCCCW